MTVDEIIRAWRDPDYVETLSPEAKTRIPENPAGSIAVLDREVAPARVQPRAEFTCTQDCGDTCPPPCAFTCWTNGTCCC
jgi:mersacidin/lichenicidin family type 2 lantibiotic